MQDKVGLVPNLRADDNLLQAKIMGAVAALSVAVGAVWGGVAEGGVEGVLGGAASPEGFAGSS